MKKKYFIKLYAVKLNDKNLIKLEQIKNKNQ